MKNPAILIIIFLIVTRGSANVDHIEISKISNRSDLVSAFNFIKENKHYYDHWSADWRHEKSKQEFISNLQGQYRIFSELKSENEELYLLLGDISHYLYNLDDTAFYRFAEINYQQAAKINKEGYRAYWFMGHHYSTSNEPEAAIDNFEKAESLLPSHQHKSADPPDFWNDYAWASAVANMNSHCIYAMDKVREITGKPGRFEEQLGETIRQRIVPVDKKTSYNREEMWSVFESEKLTFVSRPLGIKITLDTTWNLNAYDYQNNQCVFIMKPTAITNKKGRNINYTIAILMKTASEDDRLEDYVSNFVSKYSDKKAIRLAEQYDHSIAYEIKDKSMYQDIGGAHLYIVGIERYPPKYSGLLLEFPTILPKSDSDGPAFYTPNGTKDRFKGKIFYAVMLDTCEDIHEQSFAIFKTYLEKQIVIE